MSQILSQTPETLGFAARHRWRTLFIIIALAALTVIGIGGWYGVVPGVSSLFGQGATVDLGVPWSTDDRARAQRKLGTSFVEAPLGTNPFEIVQKTSGHDITTELTQEETAAHIEQLHPVVGLQVRLTGATFEVAGRIDRSRIAAFRRALGFQQGEEPELLRAMQRWIPWDLPFVAQGRIAVTANRVTIELDAVRIARITLDPQRIARLGRRTERRCSRRCRTSNFAPC